MECTECHSLISQRLDEPLEVDLNACLDAHLGECSDCRLFAQSLMSAEQQARHAFTRIRRRADSVADETIAAIRSDRINRPGKAAFGRRVLSHFVAALAGATAALLLFSVSRNDDESADSMATAPKLPSVQHVAFVREQTGGFSCSSDGSSDWQTVEDLEPFGCPSGATIKTPAGTLCELETTSGCRIRMNEQAELTILSNDRLVLRNGQVWCSTPGNATMNVVAGTSDLESDESESAVTLNDNTICAFACPSDDDPDHTGGQPELKIESSRGTVRVTSAGQTVDIEPGRMATIEENGLQLGTAAQSTAGRMKWMRPLLIRKGHNDPELDEYVNSLLAGIGQAKMAYLSESEIRSLGEYGALPILRFLQSEPAQPRSAQRQRAAAILADISPVWMVPDLIVLLSDGDSVVTASVESALTRLTGIGRSSETPPQEQRDAWQNWWNQHGADCPTPLLASRN